MSIDFGGLDDYGKKIPFDEDLTKVVDETEIHLPHPDWEEDSGMEDLDMDGLDAMLDSLSPEELEALAVNFDKMSGKILGMLDGVIAALDGMEQGLDGLLDDLDS